MTETLLVLRILIGCAVLFLCGYQLGMSAENRRIRRGVRDRLRQLGYPDDQFPTL